MPRSRRSAAARSKARARRLSRPAARGSPGRNPCISPRAAFRASGLTHLGLAMLHASRPQLIDAALEIGREIPGITPPQIGEAPVIACHAAAAFGRETRAGELVIRLAVGHRIVEG